jgi:hypothetical protein
MKNLQPGTALRNGERERILIRCREALAGYRGAALRYRFGAGIVMAVLQKHILSRFQFLNLRVPVQRRTSHVALAECILAYYVGTNKGVREVIHMTGGKRRQRRVSRVCDTGDMPLPRSLTRCARSFGCGERCGLTNRAEISW